jgi:NADPH:quinone reductase-like Zn-dependent oxidoreductase
MVAKSACPYLLKHNLGSCSEFVRCSEDHIAFKPPCLSFEEAASIPLAAMTAHQALQLYRGDLSGKTVFIPAGCNLILYSLSVTVLLTSA